jgi:FMN phosphatase YigB (HAD superfamily)
MVYKLITIDVWDTLLRRHGHDDSSKLASAYHLSLNYHHLLSPAYGDYWAIYRERCAIEARIAQEKHADDGEYVIDNVLTRLCERVIKPEHQATAAAIAASLSRFELAFEIDHTYPDPDIVKTLFQYPAEQRYFLSDFYMPAESIQALLAYHRLNHLVDGGFSSCDTGCNKRRGNLYPYVHATLGISPEEHLHIGDNPQADIAMAQQHGIDTVHYLPEPQHARRTEKIPFLTDRKALFSHVAHTVQSQLSSTIAARPTTEQAAYLLGIQSAPLYIGFMLHIAEQAMIERLESVYFFTREGEFFIQVWQQLFPDSRLQGMTLPPTSTLAVSRIATFSASLNEVSTQALMRLWNQYSTQSIHALCKTLDIDPDIIAPFCTRYHIDMTEQIVYPWTDRRVQALFDDPAFIACVSHHIAQRKHALQGYLSDAGFCSHQHVGIVDIGWRGTIQDNLAHVCPDIKLHGMYLGLQKYLNQQPVNCTKSAFGPDANVSTQEQHLLHTVSMLEMLSNSPFGSVTGYTEDAQGCQRARRLVDAEENSVFYGFTHHFQQGVLAASQLWASYIDQYVVSSQELRAPALRLWEKHITTPHHALTTAHTTLHHNELFGVGGFITKDRPPGFFDVIVGIVSGNRRRKVIRFIQQTPWPASLWSRTDLSFAHKALLISLCHLAMMYQRHRISIKH